MPAVSVPRERSTVVVLDVSHLLIQRDMKRMQCFQIPSDEPTQVLPPIASALEANLTLLIHQKRPKPTRAFSQNLDRSEKE